MNLQSHSTSGCFEFCNWEKKKQKEAELEMFGLELTADSYDANRAKRQKIIHGSLSSNSNYS